MSPLTDRLLNLLPNQRDDAETRHFKSIVFLSVGILALMIVVAVVAFFLTIDSAEQTMVPNLQGKDLANAMIDLQDRGLYARVQLRYSANPSDKGTVLGQDPSAGTLVKAGRQVILRVSRGAIIDRVENYIGWKLSDLELHLQTLSTTYGPLIQLQTPVTSIYDNAAAGTVIQQKPAPGTALTGLTNLSVVVSLGPQSQSFKVPKVTNMSFQEAMSTLAKANIPFVFTDRTARGSEKAGVVISQSPDSGSNVPNGTLITLVMTDPTKVPNGSVFGLLQKNLPDYPVAVDLKVEADAPDGTKATLLEMKSSGGLLTVPYVVKDGTNIVVYSFDKELFRITAGTQSTGG